MASLWNFVARLTSRRPKEPQRSPPTAVVEQQGAATLLAARAVRDDAAPLSEPPQPGATAGEPGKALDSVDRAARPGTARATDAADHAVSDNGNKVAAEPIIPSSLHALRVLAPRRPRNRAAEAIAGPHANAPTVTAQAISLDDEIKLLRSELISKLRLQNAQLKTLLERFER